MIQKPILSPFVHKHTVQVLHIRRSGPDFANYGDWSRDYEDAGSISSGHELPRFSEDFEDFSQWVFGPNGIPSLRLLAFGDFYCEPRYAGYNHLLCRRTQSNQTPVQDVPPRYFRSIEDDDKELWDLIDGYMDALKACPVGSFFGN